MKTSLVSVIMPAYNAARYIGAAIESILQQTHKNLELIIIDDCSTDKTVAIAESYRKKDPRVRLIHNEKNSKQWFCRNRGIDEATGDYIAWMDADDVSLPQRLEKQLDFLNKNKKFGVVGTNGYFIDKNYESNNKTKFIDWVKEADPHVNKQSLTMTILCQGSLFKKSVLNKIPKPYFRALTVGEDFDILFRLIEKNIQVFNIPDILYCYRKHDQQTTNNDYLVFMHCSLIYYNNQSIRFLGRDVLHDILKKYNEINNKTLFPALARMIKIKKIPYHRYFFAKWLDQFRLEPFRLDKKTLNLLFVFIIHRPIIFFDFLLPASEAIYRHVHFLHKPWRAFKRLRTKLYHLVSFLLKPWRVFKRLPIKLYHLVSFLRTPWRFFKKIISTNPKHWPIKLYYLMPFLHKPWRFFKKIIGTNKK